MHDNPNIKYREFIGSATHALDKVAHLLSYFGSCLCSMIYMSGVRSTMLA